MALVSGIANVVGDGAVLAPRLDASLSAIKTQANGELGPANFGPSAGFGLEHVKEPYAAVQIAVQRAGLAANTAVTLAGPEVGVAMVADYLTISPGGRTATLRVNTRAVGVTMLTGDPRFSIRGSLPEGHSLAVGNLGGLALLDGDEISIEVSAWESPPETYSDVPIVVTILGRALHVRPTPLPPRAPAKRFVPRMLASRALVRPNDVEENLRRAVEILGGAAFQNGVPMNYSGGVKAGNFRLKTIGNVHRSEPYSIYTVSVMLPDATVGDLLRPVQFVAPPGPRPQDAQFIGGSLRYAAVSGGATAVDLSLSVTSATGPDTPGAVSDIVSSALDDVTPGETRTIAAAAHSTFAGALQVSAAATAATGGADPRVVSGGVLTLHFKVLHVGEE